jgi:hypothetical protein
MTSDLIHALTVSAAILTGVVVLIVAVAAVAVRRGETSMKEGSGRRR